MVASPVPARALVAGPVLQRIQERADRAYPEECCGILVGTREGEGLVVRREIACVNTADEGLRTRRFAIDPATVLDVIRGLRGSAESLVGFYHSHPDGPAEPSRTDLTFLRLWPETLWVIVSAGTRSQGGTQGWWLADTETETNPLEVALEAASGPSQDPRSESAGAQGVGLEGRSS